MISLSSGSSTEALIGLSMGAIEVAQDRYWGAQTQRAVENYVHPRDKVASAVVTVQPGTGYIKAMASSSRVAKVSSVETSTRVTSPI